MDQNAPVEAGGQGLVARAKSVLLKPDETFKAIAHETTPPSSVLTGYALALIAIGPIAAFIGGQLFGYGAFGVSFKPTLMGGLTQAVVQFVLAIVGLGVIAFVANFLSPRFGGKDDFAAAFRLVAYSMTAAWLAGIFSLIPALSILGLLGLYSLYLFYKGAAPVMQLPAEKTLVYTVATVVVGIIVNIVIGMIAAALVGTSAMSGGLADRSGGAASIELGEYGNVEVDENGASKMTFTIDGKEMTVETPPAED